MTAAVIAVAEDEEDGMAADTAVDEIGEAVEAVDEDEEAITSHLRVKNLMEIKRCHVVLCGETRTERNARLKYGWDGMERIIAKCGMHGEFLSLA